MQTPTLEKTTPSAPDAHPIIDLISGFWLSRAVCVAAELGVADALGDEAMELEELAARSGTHAPSLRRLMRLLMSSGFFAQDEQGRYRQSELSQMLRVGVPGSMHATVRAELGMDHYQAWEYLAHSVRTGETAFDHRFGMTPWEYYEQNQENGQVFAQCMSDITHAVDRAILSSCDFSPYRRLVDVGGSQGTLLASILKANPSAEGTLFDLPHVALQAEAHLRAQGVADRCEIASGDFFREVPAGADAYLLKFILHDWNDEQAVAILRTIRQAIPDHGRVMVFESVLPEGGEPSLGKAMDVNMLVMTGGCERTASEYAALFARASFELESVQSTSSPMSMVVARPV